MLTVYLLLVPQGVVVGAYLRQGAYFFFEKQPNVQNKTSMLFLVILLVNYLFTNLSLYFDCDFDYLLFI